MEEFRLIVTGSREFDDRLALRAALAGLLDRMAPDTLLVVVHGGHPNPDFSSNADRIAQEWALEMMGDGLPVDQEPHPADWEGPCRETCAPDHRQTWRGRSVCPAAGPYRNREMCEGDARQGLAAVRVGTRSTGTKDCLLWMIRLGIPFELVIQGDARGLPKGLLAMSGQRGAR